MRAKKSAVGKKAKRQRGNEDAAMAVELLKKKMSETKMESGIVLFGPDVLEYGEPGAFIATNRPWEITIYFPVEEQGTAYQVRRAISELMARRFPGVKERLEKSQTEIYVTHISGTDARAFRSATEVPDY